MDAFLWAAAAVAGLALAAWVWLVAARGGFWRVRPRLPPAEETAAHCPAVAAVVPARNEAAVLPRTLPALLRQDYPGPFHVFVVDDSSEDGTAAVAREAARETGAGGRLTVVPARPLPEGWTGKVWALSEGVRAAADSEPEFLLLTDADIAHGTGSLRALVAIARREGLDLVSVMARLPAGTAWERLLIPAFVYFFAKLYPFRWAADPRKRTAAAAGGCLLLRRQALQRAGGLERIAGAVIDDCALAERIKGSGGRLWLGYSEGVHSLRAYEGLSGVWSMVARSAYVQLNRSPLLLAGTVAGMLLAYLTPPLAALGGLAALALGAGAAPGASLAAAGFAAWALMAASYLPLLGWLAAPRLLVPLLPVAAALYTLMTVDSAVSHYRGRTAAWKGRAYSPARR